MPKKWYVIQTQTKREHEVKCALLKKGYQVFSPQYWKQHKKEKVLLPLFPRYVFVRFDAAIDTWQEIHRLRGVVRLLGYEGRNSSLTPVDDEELRLLMAHSDPSTGIVNMEQAYPSGRITQYKAGDTVRIENGMFQGHIATYWNNTAKGAMVILSLLNRPVRVILRSEELPLK